MMVITVHLLLDDTTGETASGMSGGLAVIGITFTMVIMSHVEDNGSVHDGVRSAQLSNKFIKFMFNFIFQVTYNIAPISDVAMVVSSGSGTMMYIIWVVVTSEGVASVGQVCGFMDMETKFGSWLNVSWTIEVNMDGQNIVVHLFQMNMSLEFLGGIVGHHVTVSFKHFMMVMMVSTVAVEVVGLFCSMFHIFFFSAFIIVVTIVMMIIIMVEDIVEFMMIVMMHVVVFIISMHIHMEVDMGILAISIGANVFCIVMMSSILVDGLKVNMDTVAAMFFHIMHHFIKMGHVLFEFFKAL